jgi:uroporphyrinogen-III synthase
LIRANGNEADAAALADLGIPTVIDPFLRIVTNPDVSGARELLKQMKGATSRTWVIATSPNALNHWADSVGEQTLKNSVVDNPNLAFAAIGMATKNRLLELGAAKIVIPKETTSRALLSVLGKRIPAIAIMPTGNLTLDTLHTGLSEAGWRVFARVVYINSMVDIVPSSIAAIEKGKFGGILLRSPSAVKALLTFLPHPQIPLICAGATSVKALTDLGYVADAITNSPDPKSVAQCVHHFITLEKDGKS